MHRNRLDLGDAGVARLAAIAVFLAGALSGCGGADSTGSGPGGSGGGFNLSLSPGGLTLAQGQSGTVTVSVRGI